MKLRNSHLVLGICTIALMGCSDELTSATGVASPFSLTATCDGSVFTTCTEDAAGTSPTVAGVWVGAACSGAAAALANDQNLIAASSGNTLTCSGTSCTGTTSTTNWLNLAETTETSSELTDITSEETLSLLTIFDVDGDMETTFGATGYLSGSTDDVVCCTDITDSSASNTVTADEVATTLPGCMTYTNFVATGDTDVDLVNVSVSETSSILGSYDGNETEFYYTNEIACSDGAPTYSTLVSSVDAQCANSTTLECESGTCSSTCSSWADSDSASITTLPAGSYAVIHYLDGGGDGIDGSDDDVPACEDITLSSSSSAVAFSAEDYPDDDDDDDDNDDSGGGGITGLSVDFTCTSANYSSCDNDSVGSGANILVFFAGSPCTNNLGSAVLYGQKSVEITGGDATCNGTQCNINTDSSGWTSLGNTPSDGATYCLYAFFSTDDTATLGGSLTSSGDVMCSKTFTYEDDGSGSVTGTDVGTASGGTACETY